MFAGSEDESGVGVHSVGCYGHGDVVTVVGAHGGKASGPVEAGAFEEGHSPRSVDILNTGP